ncbi:MAG: helix-turn-helix domain-containing protein [Bacteroidota bacterium]
MKHWYQKPHPLLSDYVRTVLVIEGYSEPDPMSPPLVTNGIAALFYKDGKLTLFGKSVPTDRWEIGEQTHIISYFFKPFVAAALFNLDAKKIDVVDLGTVDFNTIDDMLISKLNRNCEIIKYATDQIMLDPSTAILPGIIKKLKLSERTFQRIFKKYVGITAGQYRRICQFQSSFSQLRSNDFHSLTDLAYANGFADQSHFIRSFKEFARTTPNIYLKEGLK